MQNVELDITVKIDCMPHNQSFSHLYKHHAEEFAQIHEHYAR